MTKELEKTLKFLSKVSKKGKNVAEKLYHNRIFVHNDIMYATEGHMMAVCKNLTETKDFAYFEGKNFDFVKVENLEKSKFFSNLDKRIFFEKIFDRYTDFDLTFTLDFAGYKIPYSLQSCHTERSKDKLIVDFVNNEVTFDFLEGAEKDGVTAIYSEALKDVKAEKEADKITLMTWNILDFMKETKSTEVTIQVNTERRYCKMEVGKYTCYFMLVL